jgi:glycosyltransferase involved in cell wall biosynthesis
MKILYIHQYFNTYADGGSSRSYYLAKALVESGHTVEIITSHPGKVYKKTTVEEITVHYLPVHYDNHLGFGGRIYAFIKFVLKAYQLASTIRHVDLCYATSTPLTVGIIACLLKKWHRIPFYFEVRDLWPQAPVEMGVVRNFFLKKALFALEKFIYVHSSKVIALSPGIRQAIIAKIGDASKVHLVPNMADCEFFDTEEPEVILASKPAGIRNTFTIAYFGAVGRVNHLDSFIEVARFFQQRNLSAVQFLIIGKGNQWEHIKNLALHYGLSNVSFVPHASKYELREILSHVDAVYISFAQLPVLETSSPNKFFDSLAAGKLCIVNTKGWIKACIEEAGCGFFADPEEPEQVYKKLLPYMASKRKLREAKNAARLLAQNQFSREKLSRYFVSLFPHSHMKAPYTSEPDIVEENRR